MFCLDQQYHYLAAPLTLSHGTHVCQATAPRLRTTELELSYHFYYVSLKSNVIHSGPFGCVVRHQLYHHLHQDGIPSTGAIKSCRSKTITRDSFKICYPSVLVILFQCLRLISLFKNVIGHGFIYFQKNYFTLNVNHVIIFFSFSSFLPS